MDKEIEKIRILADEHWIYVSSICEKMYKDAFVHGFKHGKDDH